MNFTRKRFLNSISKDANILEIGPFYKPYCIGNKVEYFDIIDRNALVERAKEISSEINIDNIPHIEYVSPTGDISIINKTFDALFSSHVIEHQLDLIEHLQKASGLLKNGGKYYMIIPDKRYCFDHFNTESSIAEIINAHVEKRTKHSLKSVIEHKALTTHNNPLKHWLGIHGDTNNISRIKEAIVEFNTNKYIDVHQWYFTPKSFSSNISLLNQLGYIDFKINKIYSTRFKRLEFYVVIEKL